MTLPSLPALSGERRRTLNIVLVSGVALLLAARTLRYIFTYARDVMFWDQWDFLQPYFDGEGLWARVMRQHGPHRQGLGAIVTSALYAVTDWNTRLESFAVGLFVIIAGALAIWLKYRLSKRISVWDVTIPLLIISLHQGEMYFGAVNPAHGALPLLLFVSYGLCLTLERARWRVWSAAVVGAVSLFTGFGLFLGAISPVVLAFEGYRSRDELGWKDVAGPIALGGAALAVFGKGYTFQPAVGCFVFPHEKVMEYFTFAGLVIMERVVNVVAKPTSNDVYNVAFFTLFGLGVVALVLAVRTRRLLWMFVALAIAVSGAFALFSSFGRVCIGVQAGLSSRYSPYASIGLLGVYMLIEELLSPARWAKLRSATMAALLSLLFVGERTVDRDSPARFATMKDVWARCYLTGESIATCDAQAGHPMHPVPAGTEMEKKLQFMRERRYGLFRE